MRQATAAAAAGVVAAAALAGCTGQGPARQADRQAASPVTLSVAGPRTRAERTDYRETSTYADVVAFLDSLKGAGAAIHITSMGRTVEGREIPVVIASRPLVTTPAEAAGLGRPVVYVQGNIHAGEVEGKESLQTILRDLTLSPAANVLDSIVLIAVPIYNADGNERFAAQAVNRPQQNGPEMVGTRANAGGLDLNRDYIKGDAPETRAALRLLARWAPDVFADLHTTNGSYHGYAITYSPSLHPAAVHGGPYTRDSLLPDLRQRALRRGFRTFDYGNFGLSVGAAVNPDSVPRGWWTFDHRPRFGTNYFGLRGGIAVLVEGYSHDPFERRVEAMTAFVEELLSLVGERGDAIRALSARARAAHPRPGADSIPIRSRITTTPYIGEVLAEELERTGDSSVTETGVPRGVRRTGRFRPLRIPVHDRFEPVQWVSAPHAYAIDVAQADLIPRLEAHGIRVLRLTRDWPVAIERFEIDSAVVSPQLFQWHREQRLVGRWASGTRTLRAGSWIVPVDQPLGTLAAYMLEPQSDDGLANWNLVAPALEPGGGFPVLRVAAPLDPAVLSERSGPR